MTQHKEGKDTSSSAGNNAQGHGRLGAQGHEGGGGAGLSPTILSEEIEICPLRLTQET